MRAQMKTEIKERPILFSGEMVRAILDGRKSQTRRVVKPTPSWSAMDPYKYGGQKVDWQRMDWIRPYVGISDCRGWFTAGLKTSGNGCWGHFRCPYGKPGDRLWVRESWTIKNGGGIIYRADGVEGFLRAYPNEEKVNYPLLRWKPSIHMHRQSSRITLEITNVRVERLRDISEVGAKAEGVPIDDSPCDHIRHTCESISCLGPGYRSSFCDLWEKINGKKHPWESNPFVWVIEFRRLQS
jgi:hypothetical protein